MTVSSFLLAIYLFVMLSTSAFAVQAQAVKSEEDEDYIVTDTMQTKASKSLTPSEQRDKSIRAQEIINSAIKYS